jgi:hypothetical protein
MAGHGNWAAEMSLTPTEARPILTCHLLSDLLLHPGVHTNGWSKLSHIALSTFKSAFMAGKIGVQYGDHRVFEARDSLRFPLAYSPKSFHAAQKSLV